jgi:hypothetical protein
MRIIAEELLKLAEREIASGLHAVSRYINQLAAELNHHPIKSIGGRGIRVPALELKKRAKLYQIAQLNIRGDTKTVEAHQKHAAIEHQSVLTACIQSKRKSGQNHSSYELELDKTALAFIMCYVAPHCSTFARDFEDFRLILERLNDPFWLSNKTALDQIKMTYREARELLDSAGYKFALEAPMDLFLTEKGDVLDQERALINEMLQDAYTAAKKLYDEAGTFTIHKKDKADNILNHLRELSSMLKSNPDEITEGLHKRLAAHKGSNAKSLYGILNTPRGLPCKETRSARFFRERHMTEASSAETAFGQQPPAYSSK